MRPPPIAGTYVMWREEQGLHLPSVLETVKKKPPARKRKGARMSTIHLHQTTTSTPEQFVGALTDFGPGRSKLFGNSADEYLKVHQRGPKEADVTEAFARFSTANNTA
jgi:hypothetical protein